VSQVRSAVIEKPTILKLEGKKKKKAFFLIPAPCFCQNLSLIYELCNKVFELEAF